MVGNGGGLGDDGGDLGDLGDVVICGCCLSCG